MENVQTNAQQRLVGSLMVLLAAVGFSAKAVLVKLAYAYSAELDAISVSLSDSGADGGDCNDPGWCCTRQSGRGINAKTKRIILL